jgi:hypothetical protein
MERRCAGECGNEAGGALGAGGGQRSEDLPSAGTFLGFVTTGNFACDHRWAWLAFSQVVGGIDAVVIQESKKMVALFVKAIAHGFFRGFAALRPKAHFLNNAAFPRSARGPAWVWSVLILHIVPKNGR